MPVIYAQIVNKQMAQKQRFKPLPYIIIAIPATVLIAIYYIFRNNIDFALNVVEGISFPLRRFLGKLCSYAPISITELLYIAVGIFAIVFIGRTIFLTIRTEKKILVLAKRATVLCIIFLYYFGTFYFLWGFDYYSPTFAQKTGLSTDKFSTEELISVTKYFVENASQYSKQMPRSSSGKYNVSTDWVFETYEYIYKNIQSEFPILDKPIYRPKPMHLFSEVMSRSGFTGIYVAYTGESNINIKAPSFTIPCTIAHEIAHQLGVFAEDEANFVGVLACTSSYNIAYIYSGYFGASIHLMNALYAADRDAWNEIFSTFSDELLTDWNANNAYWQSKDSSISKTVSSWYDKYLKSNGQTQGVLAYSQCVKLLVNYFSDKLVQQ